MDLNHDTGGAIEGWKSVVQSIHTILVTPRATRLFRREFGSDLMSLVDAPANEANTLAVYVAIAEAIDRWEPRFELTDVGFSVSADGVAALDLVGNYLPNAHLGDLARVDDQSRSVRLRVDRAENWSLAG